MGKLGTRYYSSNIHERYACERGSVCVWDGISLGGRTDLHVFPRETMNAQSYRDDILDAYVRPYAGEIGDVFLLQDDNARPHEASIIDDYLQQDTIMRIEWPARSPDLNPIEHVWDALERCLAAINPTPLPHLQLFCNGMRHLQNVTIIFNMIPSRGYHIQY